MRHPVGRWLRDEKDPNGTQAEVIAIRSERQLYPDEMRERLEAVAHRPADEYIFVELAPDSAAVLDTWEEGIESVWPAAAKFGARAFSDWWTGDPKLLQHITPVDSDGMQDPTEVA